MENANRSGHYDIEAAQSSASVHVLMPEENVSLGHKETEQVPTMDINDLNIPSKYKKDIEKAVQILKKGGCEAVYLFGSMLTGKIHNNSDINLGILGLAEDKYYSLCGKIYIEIDTDVKIIDLNDYQDLFLYLTSINEVVEIE
ncbi:MAG: nucleotidyltransferase domain-containing protein [Candidatus Cloacimonetes bacterium]|nr:nucleotidyltransferase domain-containing protein [Candidatus Cloacimonadota bacterium]